MRTRKTPETPKAYPITDKTAKAPKMPRSAKKPQQPERRGLNSEMTYRTTRNIPKRSTKGEDFYLLYRQRAGYTPSQAAHYLQLDRSTIRRYETGALAVPRSVSLALELAAGNLGAIHKQWHGFSLNRESGLIYDHHLHHGMSVGEVRYTWYARSHVATCEAELRKLRLALSQAPKRKPPAFVVLDWEGLTPAKSSGIVSS